MFDDMISAIQEDTVRTLFSIVPRPDVELKREQVAKETGEGFEGSEQKKQPVRNAATKKVGRNDPCPCGSGKKYKKCCGFNPADPES
ncbi:MAG: SEC-C domain-containing protein [Clostridia bacterium]|nr:SEC-C domain-containing protein [Clostridia bacterium]MBQ4290829.1 SEC-C domain-containing protein [Clostridia bacterium]